MMTLFKRKIACLFAIAFMISVAGSSSVRAQERNTWCDFKACPEWDDARKLKGKAIWCGQMGAGISFQVASPWGPYKPYAYYHTHRVALKNEKIEGVWTKKPYIKGRDGGNGDGRVKLSPKFITFERSKLNRASLEIIFRDKNGRDVSGGQCIITTEDQLRVNLQPIFKRNIKLYNKKVRKLRNKSKRNSKNNKL
jgi:hypothetical protein